MRIPGKPRRIELDFVRGVAILLVMLAHFRKPTTGIAILDGFNWIFATAGGHGVDLFFVLSGFLVGGLLLKEYKGTSSVRPWRFLVRRGFKIWPAFYFLILFHAIVRHHPLMTFFWQNLFQVQNYFGTSIAQTWTLSIEEHFYILLALLLGWMAARRWSPARILVLLVVVSVASFTARCIAASMGNLSGALHWTQNRIDSLMFGVIIALLYHFMPEVYAVISRNKTILALLTGIGVLFALSVPDGRFYRGPGYAVLYICCGAFLILVMEHSGRLTEWWIYRVIAKIGVYSYALYLWHSVTLETGHKIIMALPPVAAWFLAPGAQFVGAIVIAYVTTRLVEWPALYYRESIPWLGDSKPLIPISENWNEAHAPLPGTPALESMSERE